MTALKLRYEEIMIMDSERDSQEEDSFSGQPLDTNTIEKRFSRRLPANTVSGYYSNDENVAFQPPINCLDVQGLEYNVKPYPLTQDRCTLLDLLVELVHTRASMDSRDAGKYKKVDYTHEDLAGHKAFTIIG